MKHRISFDYNAEDGLTIATLKTSKGTFYGTSHQHPDDKLPSSYVTGTDLAKARAWINFYNKQIADKKIELKGLKRLLASIPVNKPGREYAARLHDAILNELKNLYNEKAAWKAYMYNVMESRNLYIKSRSTTKEERENMQKVIKQGFEALSNQDKINKESK